MMKTHYHILVVGGGMYVLQSKIFPCVTKVTVRAEILKDF
ncbi:hypothetical protein SAMN05216311_109235 [Chitinophaga sp. CF418]|nr:hypothetical protein SAMN05216311_109235 [Chitinophaga sp. CF418]